MLSFISCKKISNIKKYKIKAIKNSIIYIKKLVIQLLRLYYLIYYKNYLKKIYLEIIINSIIFLKDNQFFL